MKPKNGKTLTRKLYRDEWELVKVLRKAFPESYRAMRLGKVCRGKLQIP
jgi:hypothetical protein